MLKSAPAMAVSCMFRHAPDLLAEPKAMMVQALKYCTAFCRPAVLAPREAPRLRRHVHLLEIDVDL
jgi:hypothetical protein